MESGTGTDGPSNPADRLTTDESQLAIDNSSAEYTGKDDKKSVMRKVKDKMKKLGSKLKPKSHGHGTDDKQEIIDQSAGDEEEEEEDEVEEVPTPDKILQTNPKDLDVPLDEYALLKQKEAENKGDEGSVQGRGLEDSLTDGLSSQSIAEQEPTMFRDPGPSGVLQAVPTNYHYKEGEVDKADEDNKDQVGISEGTKPTPSQAVPTEDTNENLDLPKEEQKPETSDLKLSENTRDEPLEKSAGNNEVTQQDQGPGIFASKDGVTPNFTSEDIQALSKSNLYTGEPDVKSAEDMKAQNRESTERDMEVPKIADKASEAEAAPQKDGFGDNESVSKHENSELAKKSGALKAEKPESQDEKSAESKLEDGSSANEGSYEPSDASSTVTDRDINTQKDGLGDNESVSKHENSELANESGDLKAEKPEFQDEKSAESKPEHESSANEGSYGPSAASSTVRDINTSESGNEGGDFEGKFVDAKPDMEPASKALDTESSRNENEGAKFEESSETLSNENEQSAERGDEKRDDELKERSEPAIDSGEMSGAAESVASPDESRESKQSDDVKDRNIESEPVEVKRDTGASPVEENSSKKSGSKDQVAKETGTQEMGKSGAAETVASPDESKESKELEDLKDMNIDTEPVDVKERNTDAAEPAEEKPSKEAEPVEENPSKENEVPPTNDSQSPSMAQKFMDSISATFGYSSSPRQNEDTKAQQEKFVDDKTTDLLHAQAQ